MYRVDAIRPHLATLTLLPVPAGCAGSDRAAVPTQLADRAHPDMDHVRVLAPEYKVTSETTLAIAARCRSRRWAAAGCRRGCRWRRAVELMASPRKPLPPHCAKVGLVLQGGGALGAYQAGVYATLAEARLRARLDRGCLHRRGQRRNHRRQSARAARRAPACLLGAGHRRHACQAVAGRRHRARLLQRVERAGQHRVRRARLLPAAHAVGLAATVGHATAALSFYDTAPLRETLERVRRLRPPQRRPPAAQRRRRQHPQGQLGLLRHAPSGGSAPSTSWRAPRCRRASRRSRSRASTTGTAASSPTRRCSTCSMPSAGRAWWCSRSTCSARAGTMPRNLLDVYERQKDILYSSRTRLNTDAARNAQQLRRAVERLIDKLPPELSGRRRRALHQRGMRQQRVDEHRAPDLSREALRDADQGLRVLARVDGGALAGRRARHAAHAAPRGAVAGPARRSGGGAHFDVTRDFD